MRSERRDTTRAARAGRARLLVKAHLGWLGGYPGDVGDGAVQWRGSRIEAIDRAALAAASRARNELHRDYGAVMPLVVGDVVAWEAGVDAALTALKRAIHRGGPLPGGFAAEIHPAAERALAQQLVTERPMLAPLIDALAWIRIAAPSEARRDLRWVARHGAALEVVLARAPEGLETALRLLRISNDEGERRIAPLLAVVGDHALHDVVVASRDYIDRLVGSLKAPVIVFGPPPVRTLQREVFELLAWIEAQPSPVRRAALKGLEAADLPDYLARWAALWREVEAVASEAKRMRSRSAERLVAWSQRPQLVGRLRRAEAATAPLRGAQLVEAIHQAAQDERGLTSEVVAALPAIDILPPRACAFVALTQATRWFDADTRTRFLVMLRAYLAARREEPLATWLEPFLPLFRDPPSYLGGMAAALRHPADWLRFTAALIAAARGPGGALDRDALETLARLLAFFPDPADALARLGTAAIGPEAIEVAAALTATPADFTALAARLASAEADLLPSSIIELRRHADGSADALLRALIEAGERQRLLEAAAQLQRAVALDRRTVPRLTPPAPAPPPAWARRYPPRLQAALGILDAVGAPATGQRMLAATFPDPERLRVEIAAIDARLAGASGATAERLAIRRRNLSAAIAAPPAPSASRLARLARELDHAADLAVFDHWRARLDALVETALPARLELPIAPPWLGDPAYRDVLFGIVQLRGTIRRLALRLLHVRCGPPPWDLRDHDANRAFLARLAARRLDPSPWLDGIGRRSFGAGAGRLELSLEDDPLEALRMGEHFGTCLSPQAFNFYSAVVNVADVNKRVIYGRDPDRGGVAGRCLIALTDAGSIVTFHPYCHGGRDFAGMVRRFVAELAQRMGTVVAPTGSITPLLHDRWYDDGARDLTGAFAFLADGEALLRELAALPPDEIVATLERAFAPLPLGGLTLGLVIALPELAEHPAVVLPLLPLLARADDVTVATRVRAVQLAERAGRGDLVGPHLVEDLDAHARACHGQLGRVDRGVLDLLARLAPSRALAFLRETRPRRTGHTDELDGARLWTAARAVERLGRTREAIELYRMAMKTGEDPLLHGDCRERLAGLGQAIEAAGPSSP